jgi:hypothetical protein
MPYVIENDPGRGVTSVVALLSGLVRATVVAEFAGPTRLAEAIAYCERHGIEIMDEPGHVYAEGEL